MPMVQLILNQNRSNRRSRKRRSSSKKKKLHLKVGIATGTAAMEKSKEVTGVTNFKIVAQHVEEQCANMRI